VHQVAIKDESRRFGLGSFKALGGAYAVFRIVLDAAETALGRHIHPTEIGSSSVRNIARQITVACASDGNHGKSIAAAAQMVGCSAAVFLHNRVSIEREKEIAKFGAKIIRIAGTYDHGVAEALKVSLQNGWRVVSDTSWPGYETVPLRIMQGYTVMAWETFCALAEPPTHLFIQAGVGGAAAAVAAYFTDVYGPVRPKIIVVEPARSACLLESARRGCPSPIAPGEPTIMAMLECYEPSFVAWRILSRTADAFMTVDEQDSIDAMRSLARPELLDPVIIAGESGGVGFAGLSICLANPAARRSLGLGEDSRVLLFNTEGATDRRIYFELTGINPEAASANLRL
jgi:diaminopropionate ammonia-lyase